MKRIIALLLALIFVFSLVACSTEGEGNESSAPKTEESTPEESKKHDRISLPYRTPMADGMKYLIESTWSHGHDGERLIWFDEDADVLDNEATRYYGLFGADNYLIIFKHIGWDIEGGSCIIDVGGQKFSHSELFEIYAYKDEKFVDLYTAYERGYIELGELMIIADIHSAFEEYIQMYSEQ